MRRTAATAVLCLVVTTSAFAQSGLEGIVGPDGGGGPFEFRGFTTHTLGSFARAAHVPIGIELAPNTGIQGGLPPITLTGRTVRDAVALMVRPARAWSDPADPLFALVPDVEVEDGSMTTAVRKVLTALGGDTTGLTFPDGRSVSFVTVRPTALDLLNALARAHGWLAWTFTDADAREIQATGRTHRLTLAVSGDVGYGYLVRD